MRSPRRMAVLGAGSWGTALAVHLASGGHTTRLWTRRGEHARLCQEHGENSRYLPGIPWPSGLTIGTDLAEIVTGANTIVLAVPSSALRATLTRVVRDLHPEVPVLLACKGIEWPGGALPHEIAAEVLGDSHPLAVLAGPSFAREMARGDPTAVVVASRDRTRRTFQKILHRGTLRVYVSGDVVGAEIGGAVKNVVAIGAGLGDGLGMGANARAALITRGLAEIIRLGTALGGRRATFMGLSGLGDLVLTATDDASRNHRLGRLLAGGKSLAAAQAEIGQTAEGVLSSRAVSERAAQIGVEMPICSVVNRILHEGLDPQHAVQLLLGREAKHE